jgi:hypothetical protein
VAAGIGLSRVTPPTRPAIQEVSAVVGTAFRERIMGIDDYLKVLQRRWPVVVVAGLLGIVGGLPGYLRPNGQRGYKVEPRPSSLIPIDTVDHQTEREHEWMTETTLLSSCLLQHTGERRLGRLVSDLRNLGEDRS